MFLFFLFIERIRFFFYALNLRFLSLFRESNLLDYFLFLRILFSSTSRHVHLLLQQPRVLRCTTSTSSSAATCFKMYDINFIFSNRKHVFLDVRHQLHLQQPEPRVLRCTTSISSSASSSITVTTCFGTHVFRHLLFLDSRCMRFNLLRVYSFLLFVLF